MAKAEEFRNEITNKIIAALENGTAPWQQPWRGTEAPYNAITRHQYSHFIAGSDVDEVNECGKESEYDRESECNGSRG